MSASQPREITTTQQGVHDKLDALVTRYQQSENRRPVSDHTRQTFELATGWLDGWQGDIILDSCCGVGESTARLAASHPDARVIGLDKSEARLGKHEHYRQQADNYAVFRADVNDFWRLVKEAQWTVRKHYLLYPNPYPKSSQVQKRWHASAAFVDLMSITSHVEVRSNWLIYLLEFAQAAKHYGVLSDLQTISDGEAFTPFERKYRGSGQTCWKLLCQSEEDA